MAARSAILKYLRVQPRSLARNPATRPFALSSAFNNFLSRNFSEEVSGPLLDKSEVTDRIVKVVKNFEKVDPSKVTPTSHFEKDLGLDSLDTVEIIMAVEEEFGFEMPDIEADKIFSVEDAIEFIASCPEAK